jgi:hypothetical protein
MSDDFSHSSTTLTCYRHPDRDTMLRCSRCERPICSDCAVLTPTGYRCKECIRGQQKIFDTAQWIDYPLAIGIAVAISFAGSLIIGMVGFFTIFIAPLVGLVISEIIRWVVRRRRSELLFRLSAGAAAAGSLPLLGLHLIGLFLVLSNGAGIGGLLSLVWYGLYTFMVTTTTYYRLSGIQLR